MTVKICIVTQSAEFNVSAGMRVRYQRFINAAADGIEITARPIDEILGRPFEADIYIFCKTFSLAAILLAGEIRRSGRVVGQDFFDDYFSQVSDQRLLPFRNWLRQMAPFTNFAVCTTRTMQAILRPYLSGCPITVVPDPAVAFDTAMLASQAEHKIRRISNSKTIKLVWFGIGDNPFFPVGLQDLTSRLVSSELGRFKSQGWTIDLVVATNARALDLAGLAQLRSLPVDLQIKEWSEDVEHEVLNQAEVVILPVSGQGFSKAKSLNRALTALEHGCQVLSLGEPLYAELDEFIYRSVDEMTADFAVGSARLNRHSAPKLESLLARTAHPEKLASEFIAASLAAVSNSKMARSNAHMALVHGRETTIQLHKAVSKSGGLSVRSPYATTGWNFPVRFDVEEARLIMRASPKVCEQFNLPCVGDPIRIGDLDFLAIDTHGKAIDKMRLYPVTLQNPLTSQAAYRSVMSSIAGAIKALFPAHAVLFSDNQMDLPLTSDIAS